MDSLKDNLVAAQLKVSQICCVESKEISQLQGERDRRLAGYDRRINQLARDKARLSPNKLIQDQKAVNGSLRTMMKDSKEKKS